MMTQKVRRSLKADVERVWRDGIGPLYAQYAVDGVTTDEVRLQALQILNQHVISKTVERISRKLRPGKQAEKMLLVKEYNQSYLAWKRERQAKQAAPEASPSVTEHIEA